MQTPHVAALAAIATIMLAQSAAAQAPPPPPEQGGGPRGAVFVNPMGQPFRAAPESRRPPILLWLAHADTDVDERISRAEFVTEAMAFFTNDLDANHDRAVVSQESTELWRAEAPEMLGLRNAPTMVSASPGRRERDRGGVRGAREEGGGPPGGGPPRGRNGPPQESAQRAPISLGAEAEPVMSCDRDFSRRIDAAEFQSCAERRFFELDVNRDGYFTLYESERAREMLEAYEERAER